jgi:hypothetical protein
MKRTNCLEATIQSEVFMHISNLEDVTERHAHKF